MNDDLLDALAVTAELTGTELSKAAARVMVTDLAVYPLPLVLAALTRVRRELRGRMSLSDVIMRIDDGRPGPNEAWAMIPQNEAGSVVWTSEMAEAYGVCNPLLREGQVIAARSAFIEAYAAIIGEARSKLQPPTWMPSLGHDPLQRTAVIEEAVRLGRISSAQGRALLPAADHGNVVFLDDKRTEPSVTALIDRVTRKP